MFNVSQPVGDICTIAPKTAKVFQEYKVDFCCGGHKPLSQVIKEMNLNGDEILAKLNKVGEETEKLKEAGKNFGKMSQAELIEYVENIHHSYLRRIFPDLSELTTKIMKVHGPNHSSLFKVHKIYSDIKTALEQHLVMEEEVLFPLFIDYEKNPSEETLSKLKKEVKGTREEHEAVGDMLKEMRDITEDYLVPSDGCNTYAFTFKLLQEMESDIFQHIHLESNILFKRLDL